MKIINTYIKDNELIIVLDTTNIVITKVYLDRIDNKKNMYSEEDNDHNYVINDAILDGDTITIDITEYNTTSFIVSVISINNRTEALAIDFDNLYQTKVNALVYYCNTCLDKHQKETIVMCDFRSQLLNYALAHNLTNDAINHYIALVRMLNISDKHDCAKCLPTYEKCKVCKKGVCVL